MIRKFFSKIFSSEKASIIFPESCLLTVSNACHMKCLMCDLWKQGELPEDIEINDAKKFITDLNAYCDKPVELHLIGGETFCKEGIFDLIKTAKESGSRVVATSSGYPITKNCAEEIGKSGIHFLNLSIDSLTPEVHDFMRGVKGAHAKVMRAVENMREFAPDVELAVNTIIAKPNLKGIIELAKWVNEKDFFIQIYFMAVMKPFASDLGDDWFQTERGRVLWPDDSVEVNEVLDELIELKKGGLKIGNSVTQFDVFRKYFDDPRRKIREKGCPLGMHAINVNAHGDAYICFFKDKLGNIKEDSVEQLWDSERSSKVREKMKDCNCNCELVVNCYYEEHIPIVW